MINQEVYDLGRNFHICYYQKVSYCSLSYCHCNLSFNYHKSLRSEDLNWLVNQIQGRNLSMTNHQQLSVPVVSHDDHTHSPFWVNTVFTGALWVAIATPAANSRSRRGLPFWTTISICCTLWFLSFFLSLSLSLSPSLSFFVSFFFCRRPFSHPSNQVAIIQPF